MLWIRAGSSRMQLDAVEQSGVMPAHRLREIFEGHVREFAHEADILHMRSAFLIVRLEYGILPAIEFERHDPMALAQDEIEG